MDVRKSKPNLLSSRSKEKHHPNNIQQHNNNKNIFAKHKNSLPKNGEQNKNFRNTEK